MELKEKGILYSTNREDYEIVSERRLWKLCKPFIDKGIIKNAKELEDSIHRHFVCLYISMIFFSKFF